MRKERGKLTLYDFSKGKSDNPNHLTRESKTPVKEIPEDDSKDHWNEGK